MINVKVEVKVTGDYKPSLIARIMGAKAEVISCGGEYKVTARNEAEFLSKMKDLADGFKVMQISVPIVKE